ncbi:hypothetical protein PVAP13_3KG155027 [Panicum virgatum]|uniref:Uncharacterized protein n=1 Tax=Panicum virgatum TaxID=38727 RepID=A0A8T0US00_PANVG|nr:hypothetical protein PVAP13_3KG155027 [Panicum virgatum]
MASLQAGLWTTGDAMGRAIRDLKEVRMRLERRVTACLVHRRKLLTWLHKTCSIKCLRWR